MRAYTDTTITKAQTIAQLQAHRDADEIAQGTCVWPRFAAWVLSDSGPMGEAVNDESIRAAVAGVRVLFEEWAETRVKPANERWAAARDAAGAASRDAAWAAAWAAEGGTAWVAYAAAQTTARAAARDAAGGAWAAAWRQMADKLVELLAQAARKESP